MTAGHETTGLEIAVIGMAGRFPRASSVDALWHRLQAGVECIARFSDDEMAAALVEPALRRDRSYVNAGGVLEDAELFDAAFFGFSPREASLLDPQHRFLLETAWTALEHAGYASGTFDAPVGVYAGVGANDYFLRHVRGADSLAPREVIQLANEKDFLATRISYKLNLKGPSLVVQTACSTSLVTIHLACQGLIAGECDMALAGGVTIRLPQQSGYLFQEAGILSPDGHCRAFSARAQGCVPGNGGGMVVLKRLADAVADRDCIQAVVKGSAINNDGAFKVGYTAPGVEGQTRVIRSALRAAGVSAATIGYLEAHGTGTVLGDPIEIQAATQAYRQDTDRKQYCAIGSIKTNLGHLDAGAGVAGFIKAVLALKHGTLPPTIHGDPPNPAIDFPNSPFYVNGTRRPWARDSDPRRAAVSSFGIGGTNAHVILEESPDAPAPIDSRRAPELLILSARSERALDDSVASLADHLRARPGLGLADVALTLRRGRSSMPYRRAVVCHDLEEAATALRKPGDKRSRSGASTFAARLVFMFPGQGAQYPAMGRELYATQPIFRRHVDAASEILRPLLGFDLRQIVSGVVSDEAHTRLRDTRIAQPAIFTVSHALAQLVMSWGLQPAAMIGHSIGEYVAACLSGVFSFEDALRLVRERGQLMGAVPPGSMLAVGLAADALEPLLPATLAVAAINAPNLSVVSGPADDVEAFAHEVRERGVDARLLQTSHAFHSPAMEPILDAFTARVQAVQLNEPRIPFVSNLTGGWILPSEATDPRYWARHLRQTVRFSEGLQRILELRSSILLELGPGQTLTTLVRRHVRDGHAGPVAFPTTRRAEDQSADAVMLDALGGLWTAGIEIDWRRVVTNAHARRVPLPTYPFQRERFWLEPATGAAPSIAGRRSDPADWFSVPSWERVPNDGVPAGRQARTPDTPGLQKLWMVFCDAHGLGEEIAARLRANGDDVVAVTAAREYAQRSDDDYELSPGVSEHYLRLCAALGSHGRDRVHIVHCWNAEPDEAVRRGRTHLEEHQDRGFYSLLFLAQALGAQRWLNSCRITAVSSNIHEVMGTETLCPEKATLVGPLKVIPLEYDGFDCSHVDVVLPAADTEARRALVDLLLAALDHPDEVTALRGRHAWRPKVVPVRLDRGDTVPLLKERGVYLITGGMGGIGLALAEHLSKTVKARLVLVGRDAPPPKAEWHRWLADDRVDAAETIAHVSLMEPDIVDRVQVAPMSAIDGLDQTLDRLSTGYVLAFLARCGVDASEPRVLERQALAAACRVLPKFDRLFTRMLGMLEAAGVARLEGESVRFTGRGEQVDLADERRKALARYPQMTPLLDLLDHCAAHFHLAMSGEIPAIGLLFGEDHAELFKQAVQNIRDHSYVPLCQELVRELLSHVAGRPRSGPLRVLEVGGGEGLLTQAVSPSFEGRSVEYTFTDIGRSFVVNAERLAARRGQTFMRFGVLDISSPPVEQGFARGAFDVIVAFNVLHATRSVAASLGHVRELLAPGGVLILHESVRPAGWVDLIWGLTDGWWAFEDGRTVSPLMDLDAWSDVCRAAGFELVTSYPRSSARIPVDTGVVVARKPLASAAQPLATDVVGHNGRQSPPMAQRIAALTRLDQQGAEVEVIAADVADATSMRAAVDRAVRRFGTIDGVIHAALVLNDGAMQVKTREAVTTVFAPKVAGTLVMKEACEGLDLDFFVLFSSLVSQLGGPGQVDYCAASNFQDAFAHAERSGLAKSVITINWGAWREIGRAFRAAVERGAALNEALPDGMSPAEGLEAFTRILAAPRPQILVSPVDPEALIAHRASRPVKAVAALNEEDAPSVADDMAASATPESDRVAPRTETERVIARIWQQILGVPRLGVLDNFFDLGGDSMISLQFIAEARKAGLRFTNRQVFEHQTIAELAAAAGVRTPQAPEREGTA